MGAAAALAMRMIFGVTLPQFRDDPDVAFAAARRAEELGLDGVFVFDHLWPIGNPDGVVLHSYRCSVRWRSRPTGSLGPLIARVSLLPTRCSCTDGGAVPLPGGDRTIVGLGTGDSLSQAGEPGLRRRVPVGGRAGGDVDGVLPGPAGGGRHDVGRRPSPGIRRSRPTRPTAGTAGARPGRRGRRGRGPAPAGGRARGGETWGGQVLIGRNAAEAAAKLERYGRGAVSCTAPSTTSRATSTPWTRRA